MLSLLSGRGQGRDQRPQQLACSLFTQVLCLSTRQGPERSRSPGGLGQVSRGPAPACGNEETRWRRRGCARTGNAAKEAVCAWLDFCASQLRPRWGAICSSGHKENIFTVRKIGFRGRLCSAHSEPEAVWAGEVPGSALLSSSPWHLYKAPASPSSQRFWKGLLLSVSL